MLAGLSAAADAGLAPVKVNAVLMRGVNDDEAAALLRFCLDRGYQLRFIEQMPLDAQHGWRRDDMVTADEILDGAVGRVHPDARRPGRPRGSARPRCSWSTAARPRVGVIASVTRPFCGDLRPGPADRRRPGPQLPVRPRRRPTCAAPLRAGASDDELAELWRAAVAGKLPGHGINDPGFLQPARPMSAIGG